MVLGVWGAGRRLVRLLGLAWLALAPSGPDGPGAISLACDDALVAWDSHGLVLLRFEPGGRLAELRRATAPGRVVVAALFHCPTGQLIYGSWRQRTASHQAELHFLGASGQVTESLSEGFNLMMPLPGGQLLVETGRIGPAGQDQVLDPRSRRVVRRLHGTQGLRYWQDGQIMVDAGDGSPSAFDPQTARLQRLHDHAVPAHSAPRLPFLLSVQGALYATAGATAVLADGDAPLRPDAVYRLDAATRQWQPRARLPFTPRWATVDQGRLLVLGPSSVALLDLLDERAVPQVLDLAGREPSALARVGSRWALTVAPDEGNEAGPARGAQVWIISADFQQVLLKHDMPGFGVLRLSSWATPLARGWP